MLGVSFLCVMKVPLALTRLTGEEGGEGSREEGSEHLRERFDTNSFATNHPITTTTTNNSNNK